MGRVRSNPKSTSPQRNGPAQLSMYKTYFKSQSHIHQTSSGDKSKFRIEKELQEEENYQYKIALLEMKIKEKTG